MSHYSFHKEMDWFPSFCSYSFILDVGRLQGQNGEMNGIEIHDVMNIQRISKKEEISGRVYSRQSGKREHGVSGKDKIQPL